MAVEELTGIGLGLDYGTMRLDRTPQLWLEAGAELRGEVAELLGTAAASVEHVGSSAVLGLLAKPILDLAVGSADDRDLAVVKNRLETAGWIYRGDAGDDDGGHVFVLEGRPWHRVAHIHVVRHGGAPWRNYVRCRDLLRRSSEARDQYEAVKLELFTIHGSDRKAYTADKAAIVNSLLDQCP